MFGFRPDGKIVKDIDPIQRIVPHIMRHRHDSQNYTGIDLPCEPMDAFIKDEMANGGGSYNYMHIIIAGIVRIMALYPRLNRFIMNGRIYKRNSINISFVVKKGMTADAAETTVKLDFTGHETLADIREKINAAIIANSNLNADNGTDKLARIITCTPNMIIAMLVGILWFLDKHGLLPMSIIKVSPFHTTAFVTNLKSIKGPSIFHHLYDFGNTGVFFSMGKESMIPVVEGGKVVAGKRMPFQIVTDERFCDGFYFVSALKVLKDLYSNPSQLKEPLKTLPDEV